MNKRGVITPFEVKFIIISVMVGIFYLFIFDGIRNFLNTNYPALSTFWFGVIGLFFIALFWRLKGWII